jgi:hypothetical protein
VCARYAARRTSARPRSFVVGVTREVASAFRAERSSGVTDDAGVAPARVTATAEAAMSVRPLTQSLTIAGRAG